MKTVCFNSVKQLLSNKTLGSFVAESVEETTHLAHPKPKELITISSGVSIEEAKKVLSDNRILSAPVLDPKSGEYVGMIEVSDVLKGLIRAVYPELLDAEFVHNHQKLSQNELQTVGPEYTKRKVDGLLHDGDLWYRGDIHSNLLEVVKEGFRVGVPQPLHRPRHYLRVHHRIAVFDIQPGQVTSDGPIPAWKITSVVSQSDLVRLIARHSNKLDTYFEASVEELGLVNGNVGCVSGDYPAIAAFGKMKRENHSGLAIVDGNGVFIGNISVSDLRGLTPDRFGALSLPVAEFVVLQNGRGLTWDDVIFGKHPKGAAEGDWKKVMQDMMQVSCKPTDKLKDVMNAAVSSCVHRMYVCDDSNRPKGVITLTDILRRVIM